MAKLKWLQNGKAGATFIFYFMPAKHVEDNLMNSHVKISNFDRCNDLFELASFSMKSRDVRKRHRSWTEKVNTRIGLICCSTDWRHPLMWAHYADNGRGVCLVIQADNSLFEAVKYIQKRESRGENFEFSEPTLNSSFKAFCSKKFSAWRYEDEVRLFQELNSEDGRQVVGKYRYKNFDDSFDLVGVINGPRPDLGRLQIENATRGDLRYFQCRPAFGRFEMVYQQNKKLWRQ